MQTLFYLLFFFVPLILWPYTSELFEFNKMIFVYLMTVLTLGFWVIKMLRTRKIIFRRTILDIPLLIFVGSQLLSTLFSIDPRTSWLGYYSRFNGGLLSTLSYSLLYWAFVSNMDKGKTLKAVFSLLASATLVSLYGVLEHFGIDKNLWIQDVQNRVFSTLGQPNWLATFITALIPLNWFLALKNSHKLKEIKSWLLIGVSGLLFLTLLFTKSRSGFLGFAVMEAIFWTGMFLTYKQELIKAFVVIHLFFAVLIIPSGVFSLINNHNPVTTTSTTALETGGTESGTIRKIVWQGALQVWLHHPMVGSGVETFAYAYYKYRPAAHNLVSEWDFLYNKAHNEYLNMAATTGTLGLVSYLTMVGFSVYLLFKLKNWAILAGYGSILVTNFFGFSVVPTQIELFLFPALALSLNRDNLSVISPTALSKNRKSLITLVILATAFAVFSLSRYWYADTRYALGKANNAAGSYLEAQKYLKTAVKISPQEAIYHNELAITYSGVVSALVSAKQKDSAGELAAAAMAESNQALVLSPANLNLYRTRATVFIRLSALDQKYLGTAKEALLSAATRAPTDAKIYYNLALVLARTGEIGTATQILQKTIELKANYKDARYLDALLLEGQGNYPAAIEQLTYIVEKIDPNDQNSQKELQKLK